MTVVVPEHVQPFVAFAFTNVTLVGNTSVIVTGLNASASPLFCTPIVYVSVSPPVTCVGSPFFVTNRFGERLVPPVIVVWVEQSSLLPGGLYCSIRWSGSTHAWLSSGLPDSAVMKTLTLMVTDCAGLRSPRQSTRLMGSP